MHCVRANDMSGSTNIFPYRHFAHDGNADLSLPLWDHLAISAVATLVLGCWGVPEYARLLFPRMPPLSKLLHARLTREQPA